MTDLLAVCGVGIVVLSLTLVTIGVLQDTLDFIWDMMEGTDEW